MGQQQQSQEYLKIAQQCFQLVGSSATECDTIPGRSYSKSSCSSADEANILRAQGPMLPRHGLGLLNCGRPESVLGVIRVEKEIVKVQLPVVALLLHGSRLCLMASLAAMGCERRPLCMCPQPSRAALMRGDVEFKQCGGSRLISSVSGSTAMQQRCAEEEADVLAAPGSTPATQCSVQGQALPAESGQGAKANPNGCKSVEPCSGQQ